jgi:hypothetical protein
MRVVNNFKILLSSAIGLNLPTKLKLFPYSAKFLKQNFVNISHLLRFSHPDILFSHRKYRFPLNWNLFVPQIFLFLSRRNSGNGRNLILMVIGASGNQLPSHRRGGVSVARGGVSNFSTPPPLPGTPPLRGVGSRTSNGPAGLGGELNKPT